MKSNLCNVKFREFFAKLNHADLPVNELAIIARDNMYLIADILKLGKLEATMHAPSSTFDSSGQNSSMVFYTSPLGAENEYIKQEFPTRNKGQVVFFAHPEEGHHWNEDEKNDVLFLIDNIFILCGRSRVNGIIEKGVFTDVHTNLANSHGFIAIGTRLYQEGILHQYIAMFINLKNFKYVTSKIGNQNGDAAILAYANALSDYVHSDEAVARLGGDNFTLLIKKERKEETIKFLSGVNIEVEISGVNKSFCIISRVGAYDIQEDDTMPQVMDYISSAINIAKRSVTENVIFYNGELMQRLAQEQEMATSFPIAIENKEFVVYYQPKVNLDQQELCGSEALVRWIKNGILVPPDKFIPQFERDGSVCILDFYVLEQVCQDIAKWKQEGIEPVPVSVNFSKTHLHNPDLAEDIINIVEKYGVESKYIEIELTELSSYSDYEAFNKLVTKMKEYGIKTCIDDFGTGFSSLNLLTDFMFDIVKLDKTFLDNIIKSDNKTDEIVVRNIVKMIHELNMKVIAEGVETPEQANFLQDINCTLVQGFLFDKPLCEEDFVKRLKDRTYQK